MQAVRQAGDMKLSKFQPSEKLFKRYDDKIKIDKYEGPAFNKVLEQGKRADKDRFVLSSEQFMKRQKVYFLRPKISKELFWHH